jgi:integrase
MIRADSSLAAFVRGTYAARHLGIAPATIDVYCYAVRSLEKFAGRRLSLADLNDDLLYAWLSQRLGEVSVRTVRRERGDLLTVWRWAADNGFCLSKPGRIAAPKQHRREPVAWTVEEMRRLVAACDQLTGRSRTTGIAWSAWARSLILTCYYTGARIGALMQVRPADIDLDKATITLRPETQKPRREGILRLPPVAVEAIRAICDPARSLVWRLHRSKRSPRHHLTRLLKAAGLTVDRYHAFHCLRKTCYTHTAIAAGLAVASRQLGHRSDLSSVYLDRSQLPEPQAADVLPRL